MGTSKQTVSVLFFLFSIVPILCFLGKFDVSSIIFLLSELYQLINRRNMILLCHFILLFIVKDSGLLSPRRSEHRVAAIEKHREFEVKEVQLERKEEIRPSHIHRSTSDIVVMEKREEVIETNGEEELEEEEEEVIESNGEAEWDDWSDKEVDNDGEEVWEVIERRGTEEELEKECAPWIECNGEEEEQELESVEELNKKVEEFIKKIRGQMMQQPVLASTST